MEVYHKYSFRGEIRTYRNKLTIVDETIKYLGETRQLVNHWDKKENETQYDKYYPNTNVIPDGYTIDQFLEDTKNYQSAKLSSDFLVFNKGKKEKKSKKPLYVYKVNGIMRYYEVEKPISLFNSFNRHKIEYIGIVFSIPAKEVKLQPKTSGKLPFKKDIKPGFFICCYCETPLTMENYTKEHLIPKVRGGRDTKENLKPCCVDCNTEKGGLMLHSYIQLLNLKLLDYKGELLIRLQTKIANANRLAKEIENG